MTCYACDRARAGISGLGQNACTGCRARGIARSLAAFNALDPKGSGDKEALREMTARVLHDLPLKEARELVWSWWQGRPQPERTES